MNNLRTSPEELRARGAQISTIASDMKVTGEKMFSIVETINGSVWSGETQTVYVSQFDGLRESALAVHARIEEMVNDLNQIAAEYETSEQEMTTLVQSLQNAISG